MTAPGRPMVLAGVPWDVAQDVMKVEPCVIMAGVAGVLARHAQDEIRREVCVVARKTG